MSNKNYRVMKFFEPVNKKDKSKGYVRLDMRGNRGNLIVATENLGDGRTTSEVYLYKDKHNKIKLGDINNKKGIIKKILTFGNNNAIEDYNVCAVVKNGKIVLYSNLFSTTSPDIVRKLEEGPDDLDLDILPEEKKSSVKEEKREKEKAKDLPKEELKETKEIQRTKEIQKVYEPIRPIKTPLKKEESKLSEAININQEKAKNKFGNRLYETLRNYKEVDPLSVKLKDFNWWYIPYDEIGIKNGVLPYYNKIISSYYPYPMSNRVTTCASLMKKYGHYLFGTYREKDEIVKFIYGIPGEFTKEEQPYKGTTGFKNWSYGRGNKKDNGYWLAFINPKTGEITDPPEVSVKK